MIRAVLHLASEAVWSLVFKVAERFPQEPRPEGWATTRDTPWSDTSADASERAHILGQLRGEARDG